MNESKSKPMNSQVVELKCTDGKIVLCHLHILKLYFSDALPPTDLQLSSQEALLLLDLLYAAPSLESFPDLFLRHLPSLPADSLLTTLTTLQTFFPHPRL
jgi:hypothetical protein